MSYIKRDMSQNELVKKEKSSAIDPLAALEGRQGGDGRDRYSSALAEEKKKFEEELRKEAERHKKNVEDTPVVAEKTAFLMPSAETEVTPRDKNASKTSSLPVTGETSQKEISGRTNAGAFQGNSSSPAPGRSGVPSSPNTAEDIAFLGLMGADWAESAVKKDAPSSSSRALFMDVFGKKEQESQKEQNLQTKTRKKTEAHDLKTQKTPLSSGMPEKSEKETHGPKRQISQTAAQGERQSSGRKEDPQRQKKTAPDIRKASASDIRAGDTSVAKKHPPALSSGKTPKAEVFQGKEGLPLPGKGKHDHGATVFSALLRDVRAEQMRTKDMPAPREPEKTAPETSETPGFRLSFVKEKKGQESSDKTSQVPAYIFYQSSPLSPLPSSQGSDKMPSARLDLRVKKIMDSVAMQIKEIAKRDSSTSGEPTRLVLQFDKSAFPIPGLEVSLSAKHIDITLQGIDKTLSPELSGALQALAARLQSRFSNKTIRIMGRNRQEEDEQEVRTHKVDKRNDLNFLHSQNDSMDS